MPDRMDVFRGNDEGESGGTIIFPQAVPRLPTPKKFYPAMRQLVRQGSEKMGSLVHNFGLPVGSRSGKVEDVETRRSNTSISIAVLETNIPTVSQPLPSAVPTEMSAAENVVVKIPEDGSTKPKCMFPFFMTIVSAVEILLFYTVNLEKLGSLFAYDPQRRYEIWRFLTPVLVHADASHVWGNVVFQLVFGCLLEVVHGWKRIGTVYLVSVVGGCLFVSVFDTKNYGIGASGGGEGLLFAHMSTIILDWTGINYECNRIFWILVFIGKSTVINFIFKDRKATNAGHLGGGITGFLVGIVVFKIFKKHSWYKKVRMISGGILLGMLVVIIIINVAFPGNYPASQFKSEYHETMETMKQTVARGIVDSKDVNLLIHKSPK